MTKAPHKVVKRVGGGKSIGICKSSLGPVLTDPDANRRAVSIFYNQSPNSKRIQRGGLGHTRLRFTKPFVAQATTLRVLHHEVRAHLSPLDK